MSMETSKMIEHIMSAGDDEELLRRVKTCFANARNQEELVTVHAAVRKRLIKALDNSAAVFENF